MPNEVGSFSYLTSKAKCGTVEFIPLKCGNSNKWELFIAVRGDQSINRCISRRILQKKVFPEPLAPYIYDTLL